MDPPYSKGSVKPGSFVNVWYKSSRKFNFDKEKDNAMREDSILYAAENPIPVDTTTTKTSNDTIVKEENEENYEDDF